ncbi:MAG: hypothetical protein QM528_09135 [Phycisphaerales bacterium]|nr:hypothetical protein [Phycisphaerales bacterium]
MDKMDKMDKKKVTPNYLFGDPIDYEKKAAKEAAKEEVMRQKEAEKRKHDLIRLHEKEQNNNLSKEAKAFNLLSKKIAKQREDNQHALNNVNLIVDKYMNDVYPKLLSFIETEKSLLVAIHKKSRNYPLNKSDTKVLAKTIRSLFHILTNNRGLDVELLEIAKQWIVGQKDNRTEDDDERIASFMRGVNKGFAHGFFTEDLLDKFTDESVPREKRAEMFREFVQEVRNKSGLQEDDDEEQEDDVWQEAFQKFQDDDDDDDPEMNDEPKRKSTKTKKKTVKQLEKEELQKREEELQKREEEIKNKDLRSIYFTLAKLLHPDIEQDPEKRIVKEEIMKKVSIAYNQKDLYTLLKIEMDWIQDENRSLATVSDDKLKIYSKILSEQLLDLKAERFEIYNDPRLYAIPDYINMRSPISATFAIAETVGTIERVHQHAEERKAAFEQKDMLKGEFMRQVKDLFHNYVPARSDEF